MPAAGTDLVMVERSGALHKAALSEVAALAGGGWSLIGSVSTSSGTAVTFANIPADYSDLFASMDGVSINTDGTINIAVSSDGTTYTTSLAMTDGINSTQRIFGGIIIVGYQLNNFIAFGAGPAVISGTVDEAAVNLARSAGFRLPAAMSHLRLSPSSGNFDLGTIRLYGR